MLPRRFDGRVNPGQVYPPTEALNRCVRPAALESQVGRCGFHRLFALTLKRGFSVEGATPHHAFDHEERAALTLHEQPPEVFAHHP